MAKERYDYVYVARDPAHVWMPRVYVFSPGEPPLWDDYWKFWDAGPGSEDLERLCVGGFESVFHWVPGPGEVYRMRLYFDAEEV